MNEISYFFFNTFVSSVQRLREKGNEPGKIQELPCAGFCNSGGLVQGVLREISLFTLGTTWGHLQTGVFQACLLFKTRGKG